LALTHTTWWQVVTLSDRYPEPQLKPLELKLSSTTVPPKFTGSRIFAIGQNLELFVSNIRCELARQGLTNQAILNALAVGNWASLVGILDRATWAAHRACECALLPVRVAVWGVEFVIACTCCCQDCMMLPCVHRMHCMGSAWRPQGHMLIVARQSRAHH
jgi:hypothetical protein